MEKAVNQTRGEVPHLQNSMRSEDLTDIWDFIAQTLTSRVEVALHGCCRADTRPQQNSCYSKHPVNPSRLHLLFWSASGSPSALSAAFIHPEALQPLRGGVVSTVMWPAGLAGDRVRCQRCHWDWGGGLWGVRKWGRMCLGTVLILALWRSSRCALAGMNPNSDRNNDTSLQWLRGKKRGELQGEKRERKRREGIIKHDSTCIYTTKSWKLCSI